MSVIKEKNSILFPSNPIEKASPLAISPGDMVDQYCILRVLGEGGMGIVFQAQDIRLKRIVAMKFVSEKVWENPKALARFQREIEICAQLQHPNIIQIYHIGNWHKLPYIVLEYIEGVSLLQYVKDNPEEWKIYSLILKKIALALEYSHNKKIFHRDIKPSNIMVRSDGEPVLLDFGLAKIQKDSGYSITKSGELVGTLHFMAPEQACCKRREIDERTDVYGLGAILYWMLTGFPPAIGETPMQILRNVVYKNPILPENFQNSPEILGKIALKCLQKDKRKRYASAQLLAEDLQCYFDGQKTIAVSFFETEKNKAFAQKILLYALPFLVILFFLGAYLSYKTYPSTQEIQEKEDSFDYLEGKASWAWEKGYREEAYQLMFHAVKKDLSRAESIKKLAQWAELMGKYEQALELAGLLSKKDLSSDIELLRGRIAYLQGKYSLAEAYLGKIFRNKNFKNIHLREAYYYQGLLWKMRNQPSKALEWIEKSLPEESFHRDLHYHIGEIHIKLRDFPNAILSLSKALDSFSDPVHIRLLMANCHQELNQWDKAIYFYSEYLASLPGEYEAHYQRGLCYTKNRQYEQAEKDFARCLRLSPENCEPYIRIMENAFQGGILENLQKLQYFFKITMQTPMQGMSPDILEQEKETLRKKMSQERKNSISFQRAWNPEEYEMLIKILLEKKSKSIHGIARQGILSLPPANTHALVWQRISQIPKENRPSLESLLEQIEEKLIKEVRNDLLLHYYCSDPEALGKILNSPLSARRCLPKILLNAKENGIYRLWAAYAIYDLNLDYVESSLPEVRLYQEIASQRQGEGKVSEKTWLDTLSLDDEIAVLIAMQYIPENNRTKELFQKYLHSKNEKIRLLAASLLFSEGNRIAEELLIEGFSDVSAWKRAFCISHYWDTERVPYPILQEREKRDLLLRESLKKSLEDPDDRVRRIAMIRFAQVFPKESIEIFPKYKNDSHLLIRMFVLSFLIAHKQESIVMPWLFGEKQEFLLQAIALGSMHHNIYSKNSSAVSLEFLIKLFMKLSQAENPSIRLFAFYSLSYSPTMLQQYLMQFSYTQDEATQLGCILGMWQTKRRIYIKRLKELSLDRNSVVQRMAIAAYVYNRVYYGMDSIEDILKQHAQSDPKIQQAASLGLSYLAHAEIGFPAIQKIQWEYSEIYAEYIGYFFQVLQNLPWESQLQKKKFSFSHRLSYLDAAIILHPNHSHHYLEKAILLYLAALKNPVAKKQYLMQSISSLNKAHSLAPENFLIQKWQVQLYLATEHPDDIKTASQIYHNLQSKIPWDPQIRKWTTIFPKEKEGN